MTVLRLTNQTATAAQRSFVARGQAIFSERLPNTDYAFGDPIWNVRVLETRRHKRTNASVYFTRDGGLVEPLPAVFAEVLKAACLVDLGSKNHLITRVNAARLLWEAILARLPEGVADFAWSDVGEADFLAAEQRMLARWAQGTTHLSCGALSRLAEVIASAGVMRSLQIPFRTPRPDRTYQYTLATREAYEARLPSREAIMGVADIYARHAVEPRDRILAGVLAVLTTTGLRIGEALTLATDCLISEGNGTDRKWGLRFAKEKSADRKRVLETRWLTAAQAVLARAAVAEVLTLTEAARKRARILEAQPDTVLLPNISWHADLATEQVADLIGVTRGTVEYHSKQLPRRRVRVEGAPDALVHHAADVMRYLHELRGPLWVVDRGDGTHQMLSETLFITFRNAFSAAYLPNTLLVDNVVERTVSDFLSGRAERDGRGGVHVIARSAFERFDIRERDGRIVEMTSHGFRHWVTTQAAIGGVDDALLARWQNREHARDLQAYKHLSPAERIGVVREALQRGQMRGRLAQMYFALHADVRDVFLADQLQAVHVTPFGVCVHDFKVEPCPKHLNCLKHCRDYLHDTADPSERRTLIQLEISTSQVLDQAKHQEALGELDLSEHWVAEAEETLAGVREVLAAAPAPGTTLVRPFAADESRFIAITAD